MTSHEDEVATPTLRSPRRQSPNNRVDACRLAIVVAALFGSACFQVSPDVADAARVEADARSPDASPDTQSCRLNTHECIAVPAGWQGPAFMIEQSAGDPTAGCPAGYQPINDPVRMHDLDAPPAGCSCECGTATAMTCETDEAVAREVSTCLGLLCDAFDPNCLPIAPNSCRKMTTEFTNRVDFRVPGIASITCNSELTSDIPVAVFREQFTLCRSVQSELRCPGDAECSRRTSGSIGAQCIFADGVQPCPAGTGYTQATHGYLGSDDSRGCSACNCTSAPGAPCGTIEVTIDSLFCSSTPSLESPYCAVVGYDTNVALKYVIDPSTVSCQLSSPSNPIGTATPTGAITACCKPPE